MPLVFVHGVNNRRGDTPEEQEVFDNQMALVRQQFGNTAFAERVSDANGLAAFTPYWGDLGVSFARNLACIPKSGVQALAVGQPQTAALIAATAAKLDAGILNQKGVKDAPLLTLARTRSLVAAVDLLIAGSANAPIPGLLLSKTDLVKVLPNAARFADAAERYAGANPKPAWLSNLADDDAFLDRLILEVAKSPGTTSTPATAGPAPVQALGITDKLKSWLENGVSAVKDTVSGVVQSASDSVTGAATQGVRSAFLSFAGDLRPTASASMGRFLGDVFTYIENRQPIIDRVLVDVDKAVASVRPGDDELYLVGHSFGGIVLYDILTSFRPDLKCDLYVTVGSQVALFAEIGRLANHTALMAAFAAGPTVPRPTAAQRWLNIFDPTDFVGFGTKGVFGGALDFQFETDAMPIVSHSAYFDTPRFFARLRERVREAFTTGTES